MKYVIVSVRDIRANVFFNPVFATSVGHAVRQFEDEVNRPAEENLLYKHPQDFELFELGKFEADDASFDLLPSPRQLAVGSSCVRKPVLPSLEVMRGNGAAGDAVGLGLDSHRPV